MLVPVGWDMLMLVRAFNTSLDISLYLTEDNSISKNSEAAILNEISWQTFV